MELENPNSKNSINPINYLLHHFRKRGSIIPRGMGGYPTRYGRVSHEIWESIPRDMGEYPKRYGRVRQEVWGV